jgi:hypothetical protein
MKYLKEFIHNLYLSSKDDNLPEAVKKILKKVEDNDRKVIKLREELKKDE